MSLLRFVPALVVCYALGHPAGRRQLHVMTAWRRGCAQCPDVVELGERGRAQSDTTLRRLDMPARLICELERLGRLLMCAGYPPSPRASDRGLVGDVHGRRPSLSSPSRDRTLRRLRDCNRVAGRWSVAGLRRRQRRVPVPRSSDHLRVLPGRPRTVLWWLREYREPLGWARAGANVERVA